MRLLVAPPVTTHVLKIATEEDFIPKHVSYEKIKQSMPLAGLVASGTIGGICFF
ncbi:MAG: hypothetical protein ACLPX5_05845 [Dissulfurispiraceae bacterium]